MKRMFLIIASAFFLLSVNSLYATESKIESWYTYWEIGYPSIGYPDDVQEIIDYLEDFPGIDHVSVNLGLLGFYWPLSNNKTILGGIIDGSGDSYEGYGEKIQINQYTYSFSCMHFISDNIGKGFFLRGDVGPSRMVVSVDGYGDETSDWGLGVLVGAGYSIPITEGTRIVLNANYSVKKVEGEQYTKLAFSIGGLF